VRRPNPLLWLYYEFGGTLPAKYREWVLRDGTCRTWLLRVAVRGLIQILPIIGALLAFLVSLGGNWPLALGSCLLGVLVRLRFAMSYAVESVDHKLAKHGYPPEYGTYVRKQRNAAAEEAAAQRYRERWRNHTD